MRFTLMAFLLGLAMLAALAGELKSELFIATPAPVPEELLAPRAVLVDEQRGRCYVLDTDMQRVTAFTLDGKGIASWPLKSMGVAIDSVPTDPLLPIPSLTAGGKSVYLLNLDRQARRLQVAVIEGPGNGRTLTLPKSATYGAVVMAPDGRILVAYLKPVDGNVVLELVREDDAKDFTTLATLENPCGKQAQYLNLSGFAVAADGRLAIGIAQAGNHAYSFVSSWLIQGKLIGDRLEGNLLTTDSNSLLDIRGKLLERYRPLVELAGRNGYAAKPCVPLYTSLVFGSQDEIISGGHSTDPFIRMYGPQGLRRSIPWQAAGGQHLATLVRGETLRLFAVMAGENRIAELSPDGRVLAIFGRPPAYTLADPESLAADHAGLYVAYRWNARHWLARFDEEAHLLWSRQLDTPHGMTEAEPLLSAPSDDRVIIGWRAPDAQGIGWVDVVMSDGLPGLPVLNDVIPSGKVSGARCASPILTGANGTLYLLRDTKDGPRLLAFSAAGAFLQQFPPEIKGISAVAADGSLAWAHPAADGFVISRYTPQGTERGWKRIPRPADDAAFLPLLAGKQWGWLTSTHSLLQFDDTMTVVDERMLLSPTGDPIEQFAAICGAPDGRIFLAQPNQILVCKPEASDR